MFFARSGLLDHRQRVIFQAHRITLPSCGRLENAFRNGSQFEWRFWAADDPDFAFLSQSGQRGALVHGACKVEDGLNELRT